MQGGERSTDAILPQLYFPGTHDSDVESFKGLFFSWASLQPCDWMGVCVLDGLRDWSLLGSESAKRLLSKQLSTYFKEDGSFVREDFYGRPVDNRAGGVEEQGPFAVLALENPNHPAIRFFEESIDRYYVDEVACVASSAVVAESAYNIAYPMAAIAIQWDSKDLLQKAFQQLRMTQKFLSREDDLWLRYYFKEKENGFRNWSRGVAWYMLGLVRTLALLDPQDRPEDLVAEVKRISYWVARHQNEDGLWPCFLKETEVSSDTSGSAGIAAAIAIAVKSGMLDSDMLSVASKTAGALENYLAPGGWLRGASQSNKSQTHAMDIQRMDYRVIAPWGMGLYAQLLAAIEGVEEGHSSTVPIHNTDEKLKGN